MDRPPNGASSLPLNLDQVLKVLPTLLSISTELDTLPQRYRELNALFRQHFQPLFAGHGSQVLVHERIHAALTRLHQLTQKADLIEEPLHWLEVNNNRIGLACDMLTLVLSEPLEPEESDNDEEAP